VHFVVMRRIPPTSRALVLVPLLAVAVDQARTTLACGPRAETCLEAAGRGWLGAAGVALLVLYSLGLALGVGYLARGGTAPAGPVSTLRLWLVGSLGVAAVCGGQALVAGATGDPAALGGGWAELAALCAAAGGVVALALRAAPPPPPPVTCAPPPRGSGSHRRLRRPSPRSRFAGRAPRARRRPPAARLPLPDAPPAAR